MREQQLSKNESKPSLLSLFISGIKVGGLTFGGGYAMLPILQKEVVDSRKWNTEEEILDYYALAQCLPGIIMANTVAFVGQKQRGRIGGIVSSLGAIAPSLIIITIIASLLTAFADMPMVQNAFAGIRVCVCVLIFNSILKLWKSSVIDKISLVIFVLVALGSLFLDISPIIFVVLSAIVGIAVSVAGISSAKKEDANPDLTTEPGKGGAKK